MQNSEINAQLDDLRINNKLVFTTPDGVDPAQAWECAFSTVSPQSFFDRFARADGNDDFRIGINTEKGQTHIAFYNGKIDRQNQKFSFTISGNGTANIDNAYPAKTGEHITKYVLHEMLDILRENNIKKLTLSTLRVGGYAWAKFGFKPESYEEWSKLRGAISRKLSGRNMDRIRFMGEEYKFNTTEKAIIKSVLSPGSEPEAIWDLTELGHKLGKNADGYEMTLGKALLMTMKWKGELNLDKNDEGFQRFEAYIAPAIQQR